VGLHRLLRPRTRTKGWRTSTIARSGSFSATTASSAGPVGPEGYEPDEDDDLDWMARWGTPIVDVNPEPG
jgi:hypothetical protein